jgi:hypothetical protein
MCDRVVILHQGRVRHDATLAGDSGILDRMFLQIAREGASKAA